MAATARRTRLAPGLLALAVGGFGIGLTEFVIMGLLPELARDFDTSVAVAGWLISGYALSVVVGAIVVTAVAARLPRKQVLLGLLVLFILGNLVSAVAPDYWTMMAGRVVAALCHGAFFGIGSVLAASLVEPSRRAGAIATMFAGLTIANVLGVPLGTLVGQQLGWRATFWVIVVVGLVALVGIAALVPSSPAPRDTRLSQELGVFRRPQVWASIAMTVLGFGGMFGAFSYIAFVLTDVSGFPSGAVPWLLMVFGVGLFAGNIAGGRAADAALDRALVVLLALLTVVMVCFALTAASAPLTILWLVLMGGFGFSIVPGLQMRVMRAAPEAPTMASSANIGAFNVGNALGAWLGGLGIEAGWGYTAPLWIGAALVAGAAVLALVAGDAVRRSDHEVAGERTESTQAVSSTSTVGT